MVTATRTTGVGRHGWCGGRRPPNEAGHRRLRRLERTHRLRRRARPALRNPARLAAHLAAAPPGSALPTDRRAGRARRSMVTATRTTGVSRHGWSGGRRPPYEAGHRRLRRLERRPRLRRRARPPLRVPAGCASGGGAPGSALPAECRAGRARRSSVLQREARDRQPRAPFEAAGPQANRIQNAATPATTPAPSSQWVRRIPSTGSPFL